MKKIVFFLIMSVGWMMLFSQTRLKDISSFSGVESTELIGYGLVVGLQGSGDGTSSQMTIQSIVNMLEHFGLSVPKDRIRANNVAAVMVTGSLPPFSKIGSRFDVNVSSVGDARSLEGGVLLMTPLIGLDNNRYALAQGPVSFGGFNEEIKGTKLRKNYTNVGRIPNGAITEKEIPFKMISNGEVSLSLKNADFTTAQRIVTVINGNYRSRIAKAEDSRTVSITVPDSIMVRNNIVGFVSTIENLLVIPEQSAKVVINERTGTIVAGGNIHISKIAIAHGNLVIQINTTEQTASVGQFSLQTTQTQIQSKETSRVMVMESATVEDLAKALNSIKVSPRDMISIFQSIKEAGALQAELKIL